MRKQTFDSCANDVMMSRSGKTWYSALLLEGDDDLRVYGNYINQECLPFAMNGRQQVLGTLKILAFRKQRGVAGIIDADCDYLNGTTHPANVCRTDLRDLECMLIDSPALRKVLNENLVPLDVNVEDLKQRLVHACKDLGYLRWVALTKGWSLDFKTVSLKNCIQPNDLSADRQKMVAEVLKQNVGFQATTDELTKLIGEVELATHKGFHVCAGHDLAAVLALWIEHKRGYEISRYKVQQQLRLAIESEHFLRSNLIAQMREWERGNVPYKLLR